jgi:hypothetical protein
MHCAGVASAENQAGAAHRRLMTGAAIVVETWTVMLRCGAGYLAIPGTPIPPATVGRPPHCRNSEEQEDRRVRARNENMEDGKHSRRWINGQRSST